MKRCTVQKNRGEIGFVRLSKVQKCGYIISSRINMKKYKVYTV